jgi:trigger factor
MKSNLETQSTLERKLNIEVPAAEVQAAFDRALKGVQRSAAVKGFRKGKAPITTIKSIYGERVKQDVIQDIIQSNYATALKEHSLDPVSYPTIEFDPMEDEKDFAFSAEFEVRPEVKSITIDGLKVKKEKLEITDKTVDDTLDEIRRSRAETVPVFEERSAQKGDIAILDFKGFVDGQPIDNGSAENHELELGSNSFIPGFEEGVIGMRPGVTAPVKAQFPEGYHATELAGKTAEFQVTLKSLKAKKLPEVNDEFAKSLGPYENVAGLRKTIREDYEKREGKRVHEDLKNRLMKALVDKNPVPVPKSLLGDQKKALVEDFEKRMQQQGMASEQFEDYKSKWDSDFEQTASYMIQSSFLIDKLAADQNLRATSSDIDAKLVEYAKETGIEMKRLNEYYSEQDRKARLAYQITEEKVLEFLLAKAKVEEVSKEQLEKENPTPAS